MYMYVHVYCVYPVMSKIPKQLTNCTKEEKQESTSFPLFSFKGVLCHVCTIPLPFLTLCSK